MVLKYLETTPSSYDQLSRPSASARAHGAARVLIVDDDPDIRRNYSEALIRAGYRVDSAEDGEAEWRLLGATNPGSHGYDLVITNNMPKAAGLEPIKPRHSQPMTLLVVLTPQAGQGNAERIQLAAILPRPFDPGQLLERVGTILHNTQGANLS